jgi:hypothetical protein
MAGSIIELTAYAVILPVSRRPQLNLVEETVLHYLREGYPCGKISRLLGFDATHAADELKKKKFLYGDGSLKLADPRDYDVFFPREYKHCYIFRTADKMRFYDRFTYAHETRFDNVALQNKLGDEYVSKDILKKIFAFDTFPVTYNPAQSGCESPVRRITDVI